ncbi:MAG: GyrI-like domain-containing protein [Acidobacteriota bacterium]
MLTPRSLHVSLSLSLGFALAATGFAQAQTSPTQTSSAPAASASVPKIVDQASFTVVGVTVRTNNAKEAGGQGEIPQLWQSAMQNGTLEQIPNKAGDGLVVVYSDYASDHTGDYNYTLGYKVTSADKIPDGMVAKTIPAGRYAVLTSAQGPPQEVIAALWQRINSMTPQQLGGVRAYKDDFETYGELTDFSSMQMTAHLGLR